MPELPDLTIYAKNLRKQVLGKQIVSADVFNHAKVNVPPETFRQALCGSEVASIERDGKELFFHLANGNVFSVHLMLFGKFTRMPTPDVHSIFSKVVSIGFEGGESLVISDTKCMCRVALNPPRPTVPDALSDSFTFDYFKKMAGKKSGMNVKAFLIDQKIVRGIGNAYVDEILWKGNVSPKSIIGKIPPEYLYVLYEAIRWVMEDAITQIEAISPDIISGEERSFLRVHTPKRRQTPDGDPILCEEIATKRTYYTDRQRLYI